MKQYAVCSDAFTQNIEYQDEAEGLQDLHPDLSDDVGIPSTVTNPNPLCKNSNGIEITIIKVMTIPNLTIRGVYRSPKVPVTQMCTALM